MKKIITNWGVVWSLISLTGLVLTIFLINKEVSMALIPIFSVSFGASISASIQSYISQINIDTQYRLAVLEKRIDAHQSAFTHWRHLIQVMNSKSEEHYRIIKEAEVWWENNCLYLDSDIRSKFQSVIMNVSAYPAYSSTKDVVLVQKVFDEISSFGNELLQSLNLPKIKDIDKIISQ